MITLNFKGNAQSPPPAPKPPAPMEAANNVPVSSGAGPRKRGFANTFLSGAGGVSNQDSVRKTLLGM